MANNLLTIKMITREALRLYRNSNSFLKNVDTQYDSSFAKTGAKIGNNLNIRLPNDYVVGTGPTITPQGTTERQTSLSITNQFNVAMSFSSSDMALSLDDFSKRILAPAVNRLAGQVAMTLMSTVDAATMGGQGPAQHFVHNTDGSGNTISPTAATVLQGGAILTNNGVPEGTRRVAMVDPMTEARLVTGFSGLFNPQSKIGDQFETGLLSKNTLGFDWYRDQTILKHNTGTLTGVTVNGASQTGTALTVTVAAGGSVSLNPGDVFTVAGVYGVNYTTGASTGTLRQFTYNGTETLTIAASGSGSIPIYPALTPTGSTPGAQVAYGTVTASPATGAVLTLANTAGESYRANLLYVPEAFTMATADLPMDNRQGVEMHRESYDGVSMRMAQQYNVMTDQFITRLDVLCGMALLRPEWVVRMADAI
ncbi:P22 phage major capsid protein family protein [Gluconobacter cerinus]|uniref:p22 coat protein n=1 Tax=Gluconobacter cerinus TaxID=38307 RepID=A0A1B6VPY9_9PROT|nr:P22 phage major capsid protein family protein [Gluconobacter cerinus]OAJ69037.1 P22 coat protein [Gluconobacter cerinus]